MCVVTWVVLRSCVNVPFWDDFDAYLAYLIRIDDASGLWARLRITSEFHNEHITFFSRFAIWMAHDIFGSIDFRILALVSAFMLVPITALLAFSLRDRDDRAAALFFSSIFLFNLQHYENLLWGGSSVDHFGVVLISVTALWLLHRGDTWWWLIASAVCACLATYTLAHGMLVFPVGLLALIAARRWRHAIVWTCVGAVAIGAWLMGYEGSPVRRIFHPSLETAWQFLHFWLGMLGAPVSFGSRAAAPWIGVGVVALAMAAWRTGALRRYRFHTSVVAFAVASTLMIAVARVGLLGPMQFLGSRYRILACIILSTLAWMVWREGGARLRFGRAAQIVVAVLCIAFAIEKTSSHAWRGPAYRDRHLIAAKDYSTNHTLAGSRVRLYYDIPKADGILEECAQRGIYDLAAVGEHAPRVATLPREVLGGSEAPAEPAH